MAKRRPRVSHKASKARGRDARASRRAHIAPLWTQCKGGCRGRRLAALCGARAGGAGSCVRGALVKAPGPRAAQTSGPGPQRPHACTLGQMRRPGRGHEGGPGTTNVSPAGCKEKAAWAALGRPGVGAAAALPWWQGAWGGHRIRAAGRGRGAAHRRPQLGEPPAVQQPQKQVRGSKLGSKGSCGGWEMG
jgi:hypothetical protein